MNLWVIAFPFLMFLGSVGTYLSSPQTVMTLKANVGIAIGILSLRPSVEWARISPWAPLAYLPISLSLNVLLTLMIVVRLVLYGRNVRTATGSPAGISGLYKAVATMLVESSAIFAVSSLLVVVTWGVNIPVMNVFLPILGETQVRAFTPLRPLDRLSHVTTEWAGHCFITHHSTGRKQERIDERHRHPPKYQSVQSQEPGGTHWYSDALPGGYPMDSVVEHGMRSGEPVDGVDTVIDIRWDGV